MKEFSLPAIRVAGRNGLHRNARAEVKVDGSVHVFLTTKPVIGEQIPAFVIGADGDYEKTRIALLDIVEALP